jgi:hypothetical protein
MNTDVADSPGAVFMDPGLRRDDETRVAAGERIAN